MSGLTDNTQLKAAGSKRDLSPESRSKPIQAFTYKIRAKARKRNHSKEPSWVAGIRYCAQVARDARREKTYSVSQEKVFPGWTLPPSQDEERQSRRRVGCKVPGARDGVAGGIRLVWKLWVPAVEVNYAVAPRVQAWVCGFVWRNICCLATCDLHGLGVFHFSLLKIKTWDNILVKSNGTSGINSQGGFRQQSIRHQLLWPWKSSLCERCQIEHTSAVVSLVVVVYPVLQNQ